MNPSKTKSITFSNKKEKESHPVLSMRGCPIDEVVSHTQSNMSWNNHILSVYEKASQRLNMLKPL
jgi:hypothetical protein